MSSIAFSSQSSHSPSSRVNNKQVTLPIFCFPGQCPAIGNVELNWKESKSTPRFQEKGGGTRLAPLSRSPC
ncbi:hypothetical protein M378DRAFT_171925 [Amanita muscaria Koide BX008]|uniref:Uncharacterized protein n=1 Tax=Amanita muscaria (strain Koide BX008) TaxID=946122 RepID=A0A0C2S3L4_AMAMK|nr:hypothetical protein M378DRAFT_171925 [Amanita muscaria Koide BX008]